MYTALPTEKTVGFGHGLVGNSFNAYQEDNTTSPPLHFHMFYVTEFPTVHVMRISLETLRQTLESNTSKRETMQPPETGKHLRTPEEIENIQLHAKRDPLTG